MAVTWGFRCVAYGVVSSMVVAVLSSLCLSNETELVGKIITGSLAALIGITSLIAFHISSLRCSESHTLRTLLLSYRWHQGEKVATPFLMAKMKQMWSNPRKAQEELLQKLTRRDAKTEYGRHHRLGEIHSLEDLVKKHPLTSYDHYQKYIERLADGEEGVIVGEKPVRFGVTSGTTGVGKKIPYVGLFYSGDAVGKKFYRLTGYQGSRRPSPVQKRCYLYIHPKAAYTKSGIIVCPYVLFADGDKFLFAEHSSPRPAFLISDEPASAYVHMLFAIADRNLGQLRAMFSPQLYRALKCVETNWEMMLSDLSTGKISAKIPLEPELRCSIQSYMRIDVGRVAELRKEFEKGFEGIVKRIWPHLGGMDAVEHLGYKKRIEETYGKGFVVGSLRFGGTEAGIIAINVWMKEEVPRYAFLPLNSIFEFIPEDQSSEENPKTLLLDEVEKGKNYELVMTTRTGLYRYRNGDVIEVTGFHENCPVFKMKYRIGELLNLVGEMLNSSIVATAVTETVEGWAGCQLIDWTCAESSLYDPTTSDLFHVVFVEVDPGDMKITDEQRLQFDANLQKGHDLYKNRRKSHFISPARAHVVRPGTFKELRDYTVSRTTASVNQFKTPRKLRTKELVEWMLQRVA
ncbi:uncharacterized protein [Asterias amurensis]|uniref:uncharacterized protein isoform X1 n=1 Tax=Asterias amurensis TaxID=7602 RepID=UPI003AB70B88